LGEGRLEGSGGLDGVGLMAQGELRCGLGWVKMVWVGLGYDRVRVGKGHVR